MTLTLYTLGSGARIPDMHADDVREVAGVIEAYRSTLTFEDAVAHGLAAWRACRERRAIRERAADRRRELVRGIAGVVLASLSLAVLAGCGPQSRQDFLVAVPGQPPRCVSVYSILERPYTLQAGCVVFMDSKGGEHYDGPEIPGPTFCGTVTIEPVASCPRLPAEAAR